MGALGNYASSLLQLKQTLQSSQLTRKNTGTSDFRKAAIVSKQVPEIKVFFLDPVQLVSNIAEAGYSHAMIIRDRSYWRHTEPEVIEETD